MAKEKFELTELEIMWLALNREGITFKVLHKKMNEVLEKKLTYHGLYQRFRGKYRNKEGNIKMDDKTRKAFWEVVPYPKKRLPKKSQ